MEIHVKEQLEDQALHCAVCREPFAHWSAVCEDCGTRLHFGCRGLIGRCPTLGCPQSLVAPERGRAEHLRPEEPRRRRRLVRALTSLRRVSWQRAVLSQLLGAALLIGITGLCLAQVVTYADTKGTRAHADMRSLSDAVKLHRLHTGPLPRYLEDLRRCPPGTGGWQGPYIARFDRGAFTDPWGNPYVYRPYGGSAFELLSYGADGAPGGEGDAADRVQREGFPAR